LKLYLIRHAEIAGDPHQWYRPPVQGCLSDHGCRQAAAVAVALEKVEFTAICASPLGRALQTAQALSQHRQMQIEVAPWLIEWRPAIVTDGCDETRYEQMMQAAAQVRPEQSWKTAAGEGTLEMAHRIVPGFLKLMSDHGVHAGHGGYLIDDAEDNQRIALVGHGGSLGMLLSFLLGVPLKPYAPVAFAQTGVAIVSFVRRVDVWYPVLQVLPPYQE
jgi:broad specificity phosphatase PhoE